MVASDSTAKRTVFPMESLIFKHFPFPLGNIIIVFVSQLPKARIRITHYKILTICFRYVNVHAMWQNDNLFNISKVVENVLRLYDTWPHLKMLSSAFMFYAIKSTMC